MKFQVRFTVDGKKAGEVLDTFRELKSATRDFNSKWDVTIDGDDLTKIPNDLNIRVVVDKLGVRLVDIPYKVISATYDDIRHHARITFENDIEVTFTNGKITTIQGPSDIVVPLVKSWYDRYQEEERRKEEERRRREEQAREERRVRFKSALKEARLVVAMLHKAANELAASLTRMEREYNDYDDYHVNDVVDEVMHKYGIWTDEE